MAVAAAALVFVLAAAAGVISLADFVGRGGITSALVVDVFFEAAPAAVETSDPDDAGDVVVTEFEVAEFDADGVLEFASLVELLEDASVEVASPEDPFHCRKRNAPATRTRIPTTTMGIVSREPVAAFAAGLSYEVPAVNGMDASGGVAFAVAVNEEGNGDSMEPDGGDDSVPDWDIEVSGCFVGSGCFALGTGCTGSFTGSGFETTGVGSTVLTGVTGADGGRVFTGAVGGGTTGNTGGGASPGFRTVASRVFAPSLSGSR